MRTLRVIAISLLASFTLATSAADGDSVRKSQPLILRPLIFVKNLIDTMAVSGIDKRYIQVPEKPWHAVLRGNVNQTYLSMDAITDIGNELLGVPIGLNMEWDTRIKTVPSMYAGIWAGYRGYGFGYSKNIAGDKGSYLTFGAMGGSFGINLRVHHFNTDTPRVRLITEEGDSKEPLEQIDLDSPINVNTLILDGYYMFNGKHFSYAAAYDQSTVQLRSAGSFVAGAMYYYGHIDYAADANAPLLVFMGRVGQMRQWQLSLGAGYAYNWVPAKGWLVSAMFMPMLAALNRVKTYSYGTNVRELLDEYEDSEDEIPTERYRIWPTEENTEDSHLRLNFDTRLSVTYQWDRYYVNAYGQLNTFKYKAGTGRGRLTDWLAWLQLGFRF